MCRNPLRGAGTAGRAASDQYDIRRTGTAGRATATNTIYVGPMGRGWEDSD